MRPTKVLALGLVLCGLLVLHSLYRWGVWTYVTSIAKPIRPSRNDQKKNDRFIKFEGRSRGSVLLLHGLNFDADGMLDLAEMFRSLQLDVLVPRLAGHRGDIRESQIIPTHIWFEQISSWQKQLGHPLICAGFSLGGLLVVNGYFTGDLNCDYFVLFAPALKLKLPKWAIAGFTSIIPPSLMVPSAVPDHYKHFAVVGLGPSMAAPQVLQNLLEHRRERPLPPGIVFVDSRDKVIDGPGVVETVQQSYPIWKVVPVQVDPQANDNHAYHLIVDQQHMGEAQWKQIRHEIDNLLAPILN